MLMKMRDMMKRKNGQKGFTLVELIVVMAILAVLAAIAVPKYGSILADSKIKADTATAASIASACRIQETATGKEVTSVTYAADTDTTLQPTYMTVPAAAQSGGVFAKESGGGTDPYVISFGAAGSVYHVTEGVAGAVKQGGGEG